jgi:hypothetical protein
MNRNELISSLNLSGLGMEVGVQTGVFAEKILENSNLHLILLDSWRYIEGYFDIANTKTDTHIAYMNSTIRRLARFENRFSVLREFSEKAATFFKDELFDFIYIDANHSEAAVTKDLETWYPKVKIGGIFAGHDYLNKKTDKHDFGVETAVDNFARLHAKHVNATQESFPTWYFTK